MSIAVMNRVWQSQEVSKHPELIVLLALADFSDDDGVCFPKMSTIARKARMSERNTQRMIQHLCDQGWLLIVEKGGFRNGRNVPNKYRILLRGDNLTPHGVTEFRHPGGDKAVSPQVVTELRHPNRHKEPSKETMTTKANSQLKEKQSIVVASSGPHNDDEPTEIVVADSPSEIRKTDFGKSEKPLSGNPEKHFRQSGKTSFGIKKEENTAEITHKKNDDDQLKLHAQVVTTPSVVVVASSWPGDDDEPAEIVEKLTEKLKLSYDQSKTVQFYLDQDGKGYVLEKLRITRSKDLRNAGGFFIRALEKDYREPVTNAKPPPPPKKKRFEPKPEEPPATDEERAQTGAKLREFIETLRTSR
jgi:Helix-turn-helix domain